MRRVAENVHTIAHAIAVVIQAIAHAVITVVTLPFGLIAKLFGGKRK